MGELPKEQFEELLRAIEGDDETVCDGLVQDRKLVNQAYKIRPMEEPLTLLEYASEQGALKVAKLLIQHGAKLSQGRHSKPLNAAVGSGQLELAKFLLDSGADPDARIRMRSESDTGWTPLILAAANNNVEMVELLLQYGADPNLVSKKGISALSCAAEFRDHRMVKALLKNGCRELGKNLLMPALLGDVELVRILVAAGADVNVVGDRIHDRMESRTPLEGAVESLAQLKLGHALSVLTANLRSEDESEALERDASERECYMEIVRELIQAGAQIDRCTHVRSPLYIAADSGDMELVQVLLAAGATPDAAIRVTPMKVKAGGNKWGGYQETALHAAARKGSVKIVKMLAGAGASLDKPDYEGRTALQIARENDHPKVISFLEEATCS